LATMQLIQAVILVTKNVGHVMARIHTIA